MKKISIITISAAALLLCSCSLQKMDDVPAAGAPVQVSASVGEFRTKADDNGFESGDSFGLFALTPINAINIKYTLGSNGFTSSTALTWGAGQTDATRFIGYYPYARDFVLDGAISFSVQADQSTHEAYTASDFMLAESVAYPGEKVSLKFQHMMSRITFDVSEVPEEVASITLDGVALKASINYDSLAVHFSGAQGGIKAAPVVVSGKKAWTLITVPQTCTPSIRLATVSGKEYSIVSSGPIMFLPGREVSAKVLVRDGSDPAFITTSIFEWDEGGNMQFADADGGYWHSIGMGKYIDDTFCTLVGDIVGAELKHYEWDVEFEENLLFPGYYRMVNPYKTWKYIPQYWDYDENAVGYVYVNATNPERVYIPTCPTGMYPAPDGVINNIGSICEENGLYGYDYYGTLDSKGFITFPANGLFGMYNGAKYYGNRNGQTVITLPGGVRTKIINDITSMDFDYESGAQSGDYTFTIQTSMETSIVYFNVLEGDVSDEYGEYLANLMGSGEGLDWPAYQAPEPECEMTFVEHLESGHTYTAIAFTFDFAPMGYWWYSWRYCTFTL